MLQFVTNKLLEKIVDSINVRVSAYLSSELKTDQLTTSLKEGTLKIEGLQFLPEALNDHLSQSPYLVEYCSAGVCSLSVPYISSLLKYGASFGRNEKLSDIFGQTCDLKLWGLLLKLKPNPNPQFAMNKSSASKPSDGEGEGLELTGTAAALLRSVRLTIEDTTVILTDVGATQLSFTIAESIVVEPVQEGGADVAFECSIQEAVLTHHTGRNVETPVVVIRDVLMAIAFRLDPHLSAIASTLTVDSATGTVTLPLLQALSDVASALRPVAPTQGSQRPSTRPRRVAFDPEEHELLQSIVAASIRFDPDPALSDGQTSVYKARLDMAQTKAAASVRGLGSTVFYDALEDPAPMAVSIIGVTLQTSVSTVSLTLDLPGSDAGVTLTMGIAASHTASVPLGLDVGLHTARLKNIQFSAPGGDLCIEDEVIVSVAGASERSVVVGPVACTVSSTMYRSTLTPLIQYLPPLLAMARAVAALDGTSLATRRTRPLPLPWAIDLSRVYVEVDPESRLGGVTLALDGLACRTSFIRAGAGVVTTVYASPATVSLGVGGAVVATINCTESDEIGVRVALAPPTPPAPAPTDPAEWGGSAAVGVDVNVPCVAVDCTRDTLVGVTSLIKRHAPKITDLLGLISAALRTAGWGTDDAPPLRTKPVKRDKDAAVAVGLRVGLLQVSLTGPDLKIDSARLECSNSSVQVISTADSTRLHFYVTPPSETALVSYSVGRHVHPFIHAATYHMCITPYIEGDVVLGEKAAVDLTVHQLCCVAAEDVVVASSMVSLVQPLLPTTQPNTNTNPGIEGLTATVSITDCGLAYSPQLLIPHHQAAAVITATLQVTPAPPPARLTVAIDGEARLHVRELAGWQIPKPYSQFMVPRDDPTLTVDPIPGPSMALLGFDPIADATARLTLTLPADDGAARLNGHLTVAAAFTPQTLSVTASLATHAANYAGRLRVVEGLVKRRRSDPDQAVNLGLSESVIDVTKDHFSADTNTQPPARKPTNLNDYLIDYHFRPPVHPRHSEGRVRLLEEYFAERGVPLIKADPPPAPVLTANLTADVTVLLLPPRPSPLHQALAPVWPVARPRPPLMSPFLYHGGRPDPMLSDTFTLIAAHVKSPGMTLVAPGAVSISLSPVNLHATVLASPPPGAVGPLFRAAIVVDKIKAHHDHSTGLDLILETHALGQLDIEYRAVHVATKGDALVPGADFSLTLPHTTVGLNSVSLAISQAHLKAAMASFASIPVPESPPLYIHSGVMSPLQLSVGWYPRRVTMAEVLSGDLNAVYTLLSHIVASTDAPVTIPSISMADVALTGDEVELRYLGVVRHVAKAVGSMITHRRRRGQSVGLEGRPERDWLVRDEDERISLFFV